MLKTQESKKLKKKISSVVLIIYYSSKKNEYVVARISFIINRFELNFVLIMQSDACTHCEVNRVHTCW